MNHRLHSSRAPRLAAAAGLLLATTAALVRAEPPTSAAGIGHEPEAAAHQLSGLSTPSTPAPANTTASGIAPLHDQAAKGLKKQYSGTPVDVATYHYDSLRTGWNATETDLTPTSVASSSFGLLQTLSVDGSVFAEPLLISGYKFPDGSTHDVLLVVTAHDSVYAFDAQTYATLWHVSMGTAQLTSDIGCGDVNPEYGVMATPVIDRTAVNAATIYLVAATEPTSRSFHTQLHALDLGTGADLKTPVEIAPSAKLSNKTVLTFDAKDQWVRAGLALTPNGLYIGISSHCDNNAGHISGWMLRYDADLALQNSFHTIDTPAGLELASFWGGGFGIAADTDGTLFGVTGNGNFAKGGKDWGESVLHLPVNLKKVQDYFTPAAYGSLNNGDLDFGSGGVALLPVQAGQTAPPMAVALGKDATLYLLDRSKLGKTKAGDAGALQASKLAGNGAGVWGGPAVYTGPTGQVVFYQLNGGPMRGFAVNTGATPSLTQVLTGTTTSGAGGSTPIVSSNGSASGIVWTIRRSSPMVLEGYDATKLGAPIFAASAGTWTAGRPFQTPMQANGRVYVPGSGTVTVFGLTN